MGAFMDAFANAKSTEEMAEVSAAYGIEPFYPPDVDPSRPRSVPEIRDTLLQGWEGQHASLTKHGEGMGIGPRRGPFAITAASTSGWDLDTPAGREISSSSTMWETRCLRNARMMWISEPFTDLVNAVRPTVPDSMTSDQFDPPWPEGFVVFATQITGLDSAVEAREMVVRAFAWGPCKVVNRTGSGSKPGISVSFYTRLDWNSSESCWASSGRSEWLDCETLGDTSRAGDNELLAAAMIDDRQILTAVWATIRLSAAERSVWTPMGKSGKRRAAKKGTPPPRVEVVHLSGHTTRTETTGAGEPGKYQHRWWVRPHTRWQACGPNRSERKLTLVAGHVKGPEGAEFLAPKQTVIAVE